MITHSKRVFILSLLCGLFTGTSPANTTTSRISTDVNDLKYYFFPSVGQKIEIAFNNVTSLDASNIKAGIKTVVLVDGFNSDSNGPMIIRTSKSYINLGDCNVIALDWGWLSGAESSPGSIIDAVTSYVRIVLGNVTSVGQRLAEFLNFLRVNKQIQFSNVTLIGHSLGSHVSGAAGLYVRNNYKSLIGRIVGLDPAGPLYTMQILRNKRLYRGQASFIDIYHSNRGQLGDSDPNTGNVNIYINGGGKYQPGCAQEEFTGLTGYCKHAYSYRLFNAAFNDTIVACPCTGIFAQLQCTCSTCQYTCTNGLIVGPNINTSARGSFHVTYGPIH